ncbi:MAG: hypothetical protein AABZ08_03185 [Planctomycetota bacterium]
MKPVKEFDCVRMKDDIQARLLTEWKGLSAREIRERIQADLEISQEPIAVWWRRIRDVQRPPQLMK